MRISCFYEEVDVIMNQLLEFNDCAHGALISSPYEIYALSLYTLTFQLFADIAIAGALASPPKQFSNYKFIVAFFISILFSIHGNMVGHVLTVSLSMQSMFAIHTHTNIIPKCSM